MQPRGKTRSPVQLGDATRLTKRMEGQTGVSGRDVLKKAKRDGSQTSRGSITMHTEREGSQTGTSMTRITMQLEDTTRPNTWPGSSASGEVIKDAKLDKVVWYREDEE